MQKMKHRGNPEALCQLLAMMMVRVRKFWCSHTSMGDVHDSSDDGDDGDAMSVIAKRTRRRHMHEIPVRVMSKSGCVTARPPRWQSLLVLRYPPVAGRQRCGCVHRCKPPAVHCVLGFWGCPWFPGPSISRELPASRFFANFITCAGVACR